MTTVADTVPTVLADAVPITAPAGRHAVIGLSRTVRLRTPLAELSRATLYATAHGVYDVTINGRPVTTSVLNPGWTSYEWRVQYQEFDVLDLLAEVVDIEVRLAGGWFRGDLGFDDAKVNYGDHTAFLGALVVTSVDGTEQVVSTSTEWTAHATDVLAASLYGGQVIDARLRADRPRVLPLHVVDFDRDTLVPQVAPPITRHETVEPVAVTTSPSGRTLVDFGQNVVGWVRCTVRGEAGREIVIRHAEVLEDGELGTRPLRGARATDTFVLSGGTDVFEPTFTLHGFRYAEVSGWPGELAPEDITAVVVHSQIRRTGWFDCSSPLVNRLARNAVWSQRGNFVDLPTDCPQRDERLGWTGDIAVFAATAAVQFDVADFLHKWLLDLLDETRHNDGSAVPLTVPDILKYVAPKDDGDDPTVARGGPRAVWSDAAVWVPQALWQAYGDRDRLAAHYPGMLLHVRAVNRRLSASGLWSGDVQLGDWLDPDAPPDKPAQAKADPAVVATACAYRSIAFAAEAAGVLGDEAEATRWQTVADRVRAGFVRELVDDNGVIRSDCATVYALAIAFGLLDGDLRTRAGERLAAEVERAGFRVSTGFAGTPYVCRALTDTGHVDTAYRLLLQTQCPSWLYAVTMGATTIWERWDSMLPDGSINPGEMTSFNHYALGAIVDWLYRVIAGIRPAEPGYARVRLQPTPGPGLDWARAAVDTVHGRVKCGWWRESGGVTVRVLVPDGVEADVVLPDGARHLVGGGAHNFDVVESSTRSEGTDR